MKKINIKKIEGNYPEFGSDLIDQGVSSENVLEAYANSLGLEVKTSDIDGLGLFETKDFNQGIRNL